MPSALDIQPLLPGWDAISEGYMYLFPFLLHLFVWRGEVWKAKGHLDWAGSLPPCELC